ncbi:MAG TPA: Mur ligase family protein [Chiayiivirga sp.]|nr:Mur ligase family protein [Chiayiivirga sp.]
MTESNMFELPHDGSRRLFGPNPWHAGVGVVLETALDLVPSRALIAQWRTNVERMRQQLDWPTGALVARTHAGGASLFMAAPIDRLLCATEVNEWAWGAACARPVGMAPGHPAIWDEVTALHTLQAMAHSEANRGLTALVEAAHHHQLPLLWGEGSLRLGSGHGGRDWSESLLPAVAEVPWAELSAIPTALVTGSNGKTTSVRLVAAMLRDAGRHVGFSCTDGLFVEGEQLDAGDYSGPLGTRTVLRRGDIDAAVLETARGGILRRGLAVDHVDAAIVTNISVDHFGEYGVHNLADLAYAKLAVARALRPDGLLVLNADDAVLCQAATTLAAPLGWFAMEALGLDFLREQARDRPSCVLHDDHLWLHPHGLSQAGLDLGAVADMPLSMKGLARYNIANLMGAALLGFALGLAPAALAATLAQFGSNNADNRGRLERWDRNGVRIWLDFAHNPEGLAGLLDIAAADHGGGRLALTLGHAGNRRNEDITALAHTAAQYGPDKIVLKEIRGYERGRADGEIANLMRSQLVADGVADNTIAYIADEVEAARHLLDWAKPGDTVVLLIHAMAAKSAVQALLDAPT